MGDWRELAEQLGLLPENVTLEVLESLLKEKIAYNPEMEMDVFRILLSSIDLYRSEFGSGPGK